MSRGRIVPMRGRPRLTRRSPAMLRGSSERSIAAYVAAAADLDDEL
jgi:hypothetical protein